MSVMGLAQSNGIISTTGSTPYVNLFQLPPIHWTNRSKGWAAQAPWTCNASAFSAGITLACRLGL